MKDRKIGDRSIWTCRLFSLKIGVPRYRNRKNDLRFHSIWRCTCDLYNPYSLYNPQLIRRN